MCDSVIAVDAHGCITFMNQAAEALTGWKRKSAIGKRLMEVCSIINEQLQTHPKKPAIRVLREGIVVDSAKCTIILDRNATDVLLENSAAPIKNAIGNTIRSAFVLRDITERKRGRGNRIRLLGPIISRLEEERQWIARELHDEVGQELTALLVGLRVIEHAQTLETAKAQANELRHLAAQTADNLGHLIRGLHPGILEHLGLVVALTRFATDYAQSCGFTVNVHTSGLGAFRLPPPVELALYRIVQEALTNVAKHAAAHVVSLVLKRQPSGVQVIIADDGRGFDVETTLHTTPISNRLGLYSMYERAALLGGSITVESQPGKGTTVSVQVPLEGREPNPTDGP
jgi:PAS domain S-box-containing protein